MIEIDGSAGEGGGQIVRTALSLSCLLCRPVRIFNIRKGRRKSGLMPQHLTCVKAAQEVARAEVSGALAGSTEITFVPSATAGGEFFFDIGTAGSTSLVLQTLLPALVFGPCTSRVTVRGGTHVPFSPSFDYLASVFAPLLARLGMRFDLTIESYGFYPKGGGKVTARVRPTPTLKTLLSTDRGRIVGIRGYSGVANLPLSIAERQREAAVAVLRTLADGHKCLFEIETGEVPSPGQGTFVFLLCDSELALAGSTALGERGKRAETVGAEAAGQLLTYLRSESALDQHLPDQIVLYLALCEGQSKFTTCRITQHLLTNLQVIHLFHPFEYTVKGDVGGPGMVSIWGVPLKRERSEKKHSSQ